MKHPAQFNDGRRLSIRELLVWMFWIALALSTLPWTGGVSLSIFFYGTLIAVIWRLSSVTSLLLATLFGFFAAIAMAALMTFVMAM